MGRGRPDANRAGWENENAVGGATAWETMGCFGLGWAGPTPAGDRRYLAGTIVTVVTSTRSIGVLFSPPPPDLVGTLAMRSRTSSPAIS